MQLLFCMLLHICLPLFFFFIIILELLDLFIY